jgi:predicted transcriptional regulator
MTKKKSSSYSERMTVNLTPEQMRRLEELCRVRARAGVFISKNDLIRQAVNHYLAAQEDMPGSRRAIAKGLEGRIEVLDEKIEQLSTMMGDFIERVTRRR